MQFYDLLVFLAAQRCLSFGMISNVLRLNRQINADMKRSDAMKQMRKTRKSISGEINTFWKLHLADQRFVKECLGIANNHCLDCKLVEERMDSLFHWDEKFVGLVEVSGYLRLTHTCKKLDLDPASQLFSGEFYGHTTFAEKVGHVRDALEFLKMLRSPAERGAILVKWGINPAQFTDLKLERLECEDRREEMRVYNFTLELKQKYSVNLEIYNYSVFWNTNVSGKISGNSVLGTVKELFQSFREVLEGGVH